MQSGNVAHFCRRIPRAGKEEREIEKEGVEGGREKRWQEESRRVSLRKRKIFPRGEICKINVSAESVLRKITTTEMCKKRKMMRD